MPNLLEIAGRETLSQLDYIGSLNIQLWATLRGMRAALPLVGNRHRWRAAVHQMLDIGVDALPMVALLAMCSGFILAMQGASELRRFGALHYVIDLSSWLHTRTWSAADGDRGQRTLGVGIRRRDRHDEGHGRDRCS